MSNREFLCVGAPSVDDVHRARDLWVQLADCAGGEDAAEAFVELVDTVIAGHLSSPEIEVLVTFGYLLSSHSPDVAGTLASLQELRHGG